MDGQLGERVGALAAAIAAHEAEHDTLDTDELIQQARADRDAAAAVRARE